LGNVCCQSRNCSGGGGEDGKGGGIRGGGRGCHWAEGVEGHKHLCQQTRGYTAWLLHIREAEHTTSHIIAGGQGGAEEGLGWVKGGAHMLEEMGR
jgi:hypothetical protein